jgi:periplasmic protein TonB
MFEGSLVESRGLEASGTERWTALGSITLQCGAAAVLLAIPLLRPGSITMAPSAPTLIAPSMPRPVVVPAAVRAASDASAVSLPTTSIAANVSGGRRIQLAQPGSETDGPGPPLAVGAGPGMGWADPLGVLVGATGGPAVRVTRAEPIGPVRVSSGVSAGMLLTPIRPVYPAIAKVAGLQGTVVMEATISKLGRIESLHAVSGPPMLRGAALDAVEAARYQPYRLNGEATEVETTITVVFRLGSD